jgi:hypothetical protein
MNASNKARNIITTGNQSLDNLTTLEGKIQGWLEKLKECKTIQEAWNILGISKIDADKIDGMLSKIRKKDETNKDALIRVLDNIANLEKQVADLEKERGELITNATQSDNDLQRGIAAITQERDELRITAATANEKLKALQEEHDKVAQDATRSKGELEILAKERDNARQEAANADKRLKSMEQERAKLLDQIQQHDDINKTLQSQLADLQQQKSDLEINLQGVTKAMIDLKSKMEKQLKDQEGTCKKLLDESYNNYRALETDKNTLLGKIRDLEDQLQRCKEDLAKRAELAATLTPRPGEEEPKDDEDEVKTKINTKSREERSEPKELPLTVWDLVSDIRPRETDDKAEHMTNTSGIILRMVTNEYLKTYLPQMTGGSNTDVPLLKLTAFNMYQVIKVIFRDPKFLQAAATNPSLQKFIYTDVSKMPSEVTNDYTHLIKDKKMKVEHVFRMITKKLNKTLGQESIQQIAEFLNQFMSDFKQFYDEVTVLAKQQKPQVDDTIITYVRLRGNETGFNKRFDVKIRDKTLSIGYRDDNFAYESSSAQGMTRRSNNPEVIFDPNTPVHYPTHYVFGPFTKVLQPQDTNASIGKSCTDIIDVLKTGRSLFLLGYGASGAGKTSTLLYLETKSRKEDGILVHILHHKDILSKFSKAFCTIVEFGLDLKSNDPKKRPEGATTTYMANDIVFNKKINTFVNKANQQVGEFIYTTLKDKRKERATPNNPVSSRTHVLIDIKLVDNDKKECHLIIGDFAGMENEFGCKDIETIYKFSSIRTQDDTQFFYDQEKGKYADDLAEFTSLVGGGAYRKLFKDDPRMEEYERLITKTDFKRFEILTDGNNDMKTFLLRLEDHLTKYYKVTTPQDIIKLSGSLTPNPIIDKAFEQLFDQLQLKTKDKVKSVLVTYVTSDKNDKLQFWKDFLNIQDAGKNNMNIKSKLLEFLPREDVHVKHDTLKSLCTKFHDYFIKKINYLSNMHKVCKLRVEEGKFINHSLGEIRKMLLDIIRLQKGKSGAIMPPVEDVCMPMYCNPLQEKCFEFQDEPNLKRHNHVIINAIRDIVGGNDKLADLKICIFTVMNLAQDANNPPMTPYIDITNLRLELERARVHADTSQLLQVDIAKAVEEINQQIEDLPKLDTTKLRDTFVVLCNQLKETLAVDVCDSTALYQKLYERRDDTLKPFFGNMLKVSLYLDIQQNLKLFGYDDRLQQNQRVLINKEILQDLGTQLNYFKDKMDSEFLAKLYQEILNIRQNTQPNLNDVKKIIEEIDIWNSGSVIGSLEFTDRMAKYGLTEITCGYTDDDTKTYFEYLKLLNKRLESHFMVGDSVTQGTSIPAARTWTGARS